jgi:hypothetical protein
MFSTILAYTTFTATSILFLAVLMSSLIPKTEAEKRMEYLRNYANGKRKTIIDWRKALVAFLLWAMSGIYIWG